MEEQEAEYLFHDHMLKLSIKLWPLLLVNLFEKTAASRVEIWRYSTNEIIL